MSAITFRPSPSPALQVNRMAATMRSAEPRFFALGLLLALAAIPTLAAMAVDIRHVRGVELWAKPLKFEVALAVYVFTLAFFARYLPADVTAKRWYRVYAGAVVAAIAAEMVWIAAGAGIGTASHFNTTPLGAIAYGFMGIAAVLLTSVSAVYALQISRNADTGLSPALKEAVVIGLALVLPLTLVTAGTMSSIGGHFIGGAGVDAVSLPLMGWAGDRGDLRVAHFFATHAMHVIPVAGLILSWLWGSGARRPIRLFTLAYTAFVVALFLQALAGKPFISLG